MRRKPFSLRKFLNQMAFFIQPQVTMALKFGSFLDGMFGLPSFFIMGSNVHNEKGGKEIHEQK